MKKVLVLEDESSIRSFIVINLRRAGYEVIEAETGEEALEKLKEHADVRVALLDIMLPGIDGFEVCRRIRATNATIGIIMLTARSQEMDKVTGLMTGADDYVTKPFSPAELTARVDALMRRSGGAAVDAGEIDQPPFLLNTRNRTLEKNGQRIKLTQVEYSIMKMFMENPGKALSREEDPGYGLGPRLLWRAEDRGCQHPPPSSLRSRTMPRIQRTLPRSGATAISGASDGGIFAADTALQSLAIHKVQRRLCALSRRKISRHPCPIDNAAPLILTLPRKELRNMSPKLPRVQGLRRRWLAGSIGPVAAILLLVGALISVGFASNYYNSARSTLRAKAAAGADYFNTYVMIGYKEYYRSATLYAATFDDRDHIELQFLNSSGRVEVTTRGLTAGTYPSTPEVARAVESGTVQDYVGRDETTGERIIAASSLLKFNGQVVGVMRYVTAIGNLDRQVFLTVLVVCGVMTAVICLIFLSSSIFINNVVAPVSAVSETAKRISAGSYGIQIPNKYTDEMGVLVDNINDMSLKISQSEKMESEFISSVSHELRTPLTAINGWGETLLEDESGDVQQLRRGVQIDPRRSPAA